MRMAATKMSRAETQRRKGAKRFCITSINRGKVNRAGEQGYGDLHNRAKDNNGRGTGYGVQFRGRVLRR